MDRCGIRLHGCNQRMSDLVVGYNKFLFLGEHTVLLLVTSNDYLNALLHICLRGKFSSVADSPQCRFIHNVRQLGSGCPGCSLGDLAEIHIVGYLDLLCVYFQYLLTSL